MDRFHSIDELNLIFISYSDGAIASQIDCDHKLLTKLAHTAASSNYWLSKRSMDILARGQDLLQTGVYNSSADTDISYLELLTHSNWITLWNGLYSRPFLYSHVEYIHGWPLDLINISPEPCAILSYLHKYADNRIAIMSMAPVYLDVISQLVPDLRADLWKYLVQIPRGVQLANVSLTRYSKAEQKKIIEYIYKYATYQ